MNYAIAIFQLLAGLGAFLLGVKLLSDNTEKLANDKIKQLFNKSAVPMSIKGLTFNSKKEKFKAGSKAVAKEGLNRFLGVGIGTATTTLVQSSSLTTVMVVGFVNAGIMSLYQATTIIMGANIGTTITAQIAALSSLPVADFAIGLAGIGIFLTMLPKKEKIQAFGYLMAGLGIIFIGLELMSDAMSIVKKSQVILDILQSINNPILLFMIGVVITAVVQSSSAVTSIIISMASAGLVIGNGGNAVLFVILGTNIGTCVTALISSMGASINAKRAATIHLLFNVTGSLIFMIVLLCWKNFMAVTFETWFPGLPATQIAMFHTFFNIICTLIFLPFSSLFVKLATTIVRQSKKVQPSQNTPSLLDKRLLLTPAVAVESATKETCKLLDKAIEALEYAVSDFIDHEDNHGEEIVKFSEDVNNQAQAITEYLIQISSAEIALKGEKHISSIHSSIGDVVRVGALAENVTKYTRRSIKDNLVFSATVKDEIVKMLENIKTLADLSKDIFSNQDITNLSQVDEIEDKIDKTRKMLVKDHIKRLNNGECKAENSGVFINLVCNLERVGDHLTYIAHSIENI